MIALALALAASAVSPQVESKAYVLYVASACRNVFPREEASFWESRVNRIQPRNNSEATAFRAAWEEGVNANVRLDVTQCRRAMTRAFEDLAASNGR